MNEAKKHQLKDLIEKIERVDEMIKFNLSNLSKDELVKYEAEKEELLACLIQELASDKIRSIYSFKLIVMAINKFYPDIQNNKIILNSNTEYLTKIEEYICLNPTTI